MNIRILPSALVDLAEGRIFYDKQAEGAGDYFMDCLFPDIDSLALYALQIPSLPYGHGPLGGPSRRSEQSRDREGAKGRRYVQDAPPCRYIPVLGWISDA